MCGPSTREHRIPNGMAARAEQAELADPAPRRCGEDPTPDFDQIDILSTPSPSAMVFAGAAQSEPTLCPEPFASIAGGVKVFPASPGIAGDGAACKTPLPASHSKEFLESVTAYLCNLDHFFEEDDEEDTHAISASDLNELCASPAAVCGEDAEATKERARICAEIRGTFHGKPTDDHLVRLSSLRGSFGKELPPCPFERPESAAAQGRGG